MANTTNVEFLTQGTLKRITQIHWDEETHDIEFYAEKDELCPISRKRWKIDTELDCLTLLDMLTLVLNRGFKGGLQQKHTWFREDKEEISKTDLMRLSYSPI